MTQIWNTTGLSLHPQVLKYTVGEDHLLDQKVFLPYDVKASHAHAKMLLKIGILTVAEFKNLAQGLAEIKALWEKGKFHVSQKQEDCHTAIEQYLSKKCGVAGEKIHTGRSRNDQSLVMIRLYTLDQLRLLQAKCAKFINEFKKWGRKNGKVPMPGYTHMQKAMPTTVGLWQQSYEHALKDALIIIKSTRNLLNQSPLGSGAGYGVPMKIDRAYTARELGFGKVQSNPIYCQFSRGPFESQALNAAVYVMTILSRLAGEALLFTTSEFDYFSLPIQFCTGSSMMPQKKNYDVFEIMRANLAVTEAAQFEIQRISGKLNSGYHRDLQLIKPPLVRGFKAVLASIETAITVVPELIVNRRRLASALTPELYATAHVYEKLKGGKSFREAYADVKTLFAR